jgi:hypothetical protein
MAAVDAGMEVYQTGVTIVQGICVAHDLQLRVVNRDITHPIISEGWKSSWANVLSLLLDATGTQEELQLIVVAPVVPKADGFGTVESTESMTLRHGHAAGSTGRYRDPAAALLRDARLGVDAARGNRARLTEEVVRYEATDSCAVLAAPLPCRRATAEAGRPLRSSDQPLLADPDHQVLGYTEVIQGLGPQAERLLGGHS